MAKLVYSVICSLDGYIEDANGGFDWAEPDEEVHAFVNALEPVVVGGGKAALPDGFRAALQLLDVRRFEGGVVHLHYRPRE
jgi:hypothetical protein